MRTQIRIVAGSLKGRKLLCNVCPTLRPTPQMVREALFSILGNAVPTRPFYDVFAGTGVVGLEALSRGSSRVTFVERDFRLVDELESHIRQFGVVGQTQIVRSDVYGWVKRFQPPPEPITVFFSPPFPDLTKRPADLLEGIALIQEKVMFDSVLVIQVEKSPFLQQIPDHAEWDDRKYGRNHLLFWVKQPATNPVTQSIPMETATKITPES